MDTTARPLSSIGIDIGKEVFHVVGFSTDGKIPFRRKIKRLARVETFRRLPPSVVGMEACLSAHFASRALRQLYTGKVRPIYLCTRAAASGTRHSPRPLFYRDEKLLHNSGALRHEGCRAPALLLTLNRDVRRDDRVFGPRLKTS
jgi:hypothetical protein